MKTVFIMMFYISKILFLKNSSTHSTKLLITTSFAAFYSSSPPTFIMDLLRSVLDHAVLPSNVPGKREQEESYEKISDNLLTRLMRACKQAEDLAGQPFSDAIRSLGESLQACRELNQGRLDKETMLRYFAQIKPQDVLILHVIEQNAAILIRHEIDEDRKNAVIIESFETSPATEHVLAADNALLWDFPGRCVRLSLAQFNDENLQESLAAFLEQASMESIHSLQAQAQKAGKVISELRDTSDPALITQMLMAILEAIGDFATVPTLRKRVRDDVNLLEAASLPWRRLPFWLVLRVAAQRQLSIYLGQSGRACYKLVMSIFFANLLQDATKILATNEDKVENVLSMNGVRKHEPELIITLRTKLCRRMIKIEREKIHLQIHKEAFERFFNNAAPRIKSSIEFANSSVETLWDNVKKEMERSIRRLPLRAPEKSSQLSLLNSRDHLNRLLADKQAPQPSRNVSLNLSERLVEQIGEAHKFFDRIYVLSQLEQKIELDSQLVSSTVKGSESLCQTLADQIHNVFQKIKKAYDGDAILQSAKALAIFELWMRMDKSALICCPLLGDYRPVFRPGLLDVLQLPSLSDMKRLLVIQDYLDNRHEKAKHGHIFEDSDAVSFAERYVKQSEQMKEAVATIEHAAQANREAKIEKWRSVTAEYEERTQNISSTSCRCTFEHGVRNIHGCVRCWHWRCRNRLQVQHHEDFLPEKEARKSQIVFELVIPKYLSAYRNATWKILRDLVHPDRLHSKPPFTSLASCPLLSNFMTADHTGISLASQKKCFIETHYSFSNGLVPLDKILLPFAADFHLYDHEAKIWLKDLAKVPTLYHICGIRVPRGLSSTVLIPQHHPAEDFDGPSSYEIQANITRCPSTMSVAEFSTCQKLLAGKSRRWPKILVELGSSNLDFSSEDTTLMLTQLAVQAGPRPLEGSCTLRRIHSIMTDIDFTRSLKEQIKNRLDSIRTNWRELSGMELLINLSLRVFTLLPDGEMRSDFEHLLKLARATALEWINASQEESRKAQDKKDAHRISIYSLKAALLCRKTFEIYTRRETALFSTELSSWIRASIALQENQVVGINSLPGPVKIMLIHDAKMTFRLSSLIHNAVKAHSEIIGEAIDSNWQNITNSMPQSKPTWEFLPSPHQNWIRSVADEDLKCFQSKQVFHLHILEGHYLVNGKRRGSLPPAMLNDPTIQLLFGDHSLYVYPSSMFGMDYRLDQSFQGQIVHFGQRDSRIVVRAVVRRIVGEKKTNILYEFIPKAIFKPDNLMTFDLPMSLIDSCYHWLDLDTGILEIRRHPSIWWRRPRDWRLNFFKRTAARGENSTLVDPRSAVFQQVASVFKHFEIPQKLTVFQPVARKGRLSVELRHLDLDFCVNDIGLLDCRQLKASIDLNQDAGTWYGLTSTIVLRDTQDEKKRSIIVPNGKLTWVRHHSGIHVSSFSKDSDGYFRFDIDETLGRLSAPAEPHLLYKKALYHAVTSFCLPDPLTGVTGTEEAIRILKSGTAQPWSPDSSPNLQEFISLLPQREYYPAELKRLQRVKWNESLTVTIQSDQFEALIQKIEGKAAKLAKFSQGKEICPIPLREETQLRLRAKARRSLYERTTEDTAYLRQSDKTYVPRDRLLDANSCQVYRIVNMIHSRSPRIEIKHSLREILESWDYIDGFNNSSRLSAEPLLNQMDDPIKQRLGSLINLCCDESNVFLPIFQLSLILFRPKPDMDVVKVLSAFCCIKELRDLERPKYSGFSRFKNRGPPSVEILQQFITEAFIPCPWVSKNENIQQKKRESHEKECESQGKLFAEELLKLWPEFPSSIGFGEAHTLPLIDISTALSAIKPDWDRRRQNDLLAVYIGQVDAITLRYKDQYNGSGYFLPESREWQPIISNFVSAKYQELVPSTSQDLVVKHGPELVRIDGHFKLSKPKSQDSELQEAPLELVELGQILDSFSRSPNTLRHNYSGDLLRSLEALEKNSHITGVGSLTFIPEMMEITDAIEDTQAAAATYLQLIKTALWSSDTRFTWLALGDLVPCRTPIEMLELLQSRADHQFGIGMKEALIHYGCAITEIQRLDRLRSAILCGDQRAMYEELHNAGHENWDPAQEDSDWLLLEIDSNMLIRTDQVDVARAIINPKSGKNSVLQMNMGRGKTSCIMPMAAAMLANGADVSRLIVPRSLVMQTAYMIHARLGGLVGREICHIPFSRQTSTTDHMLQLYKDLHHDTQRSRGLILTSHEHVLSFRLSGLQRLADNKFKEAETMINFQNWLDANCRDILDESDFTLSPKTQLNYPSGSEMAVDGHLFRWRVAQGLLSMVSEYVPRLQADFPGSIEVSATSSWLPTVQFLRTDVEDELHRLIVEYIAAGSAPFLYREGIVDEDTRTAIRRVLSDKNLDKGLFKKAVNSFPRPESAEVTLLTARGFVLCKILVLCLAKRWNVQYGLHPRRPPVAVPYMAKGVPSELSEYGHPDVAIMLTCLSFYSAGLSYEQFRQAVKHVLDSEDAAFEYEKLTSGSILPPSLQLWNFINLDDESQMRLLWEHLRRTQVVTDYYMNNFVFPDHARQFTIKLQASAWDIPQATKPKTTLSARTTGFSGTNDNRYLLPMTIQQEDLPDLLQTNAEVLSYLLQPRNRKYAVLVDRNRRRLNERNMLIELSKRDIRVLIDAGAYILEMGNRDLARLWLDVDKKKAQAAVYFRADNSAWVTFKDPAKRDAPLLSTRLANDLRGCIVYFDEAHTRGVDLKLPEDAQAALTLALKQTKDNTMQAAMRLRQLSTTQSVTFFAPPEVDMSIRDICGRKFPIKYGIESSHVIFWLLEQTCRANEDLHPLFRAQGIDFCRRANAVLQYPEFLTSKSSKSSLVKVLQQQEHQTLEQLYGGSSHDPLQSLGEMCSSRLQGFVDKLSQHDSTDAWQEDTFGEVEQERELEVQLETVRHTERPIHYEAFQFPGLSSTILSFLKTGELDIAAGEVDHAFDYIGQMEAGKKHGICSTGSRFFVSREFSRTIVLYQKNQNIGDRFLRPVEWILWSFSTQTALIIIPEEVELLIPRLRLAGNESYVHLIAYAAPITRSMTPFNRLDYYTLPPIPLNAEFPSWLKVELGILAGRLYTDYEEWNLVSAYMTDSQTDAPISSAFLLEWLGVRCRTNDVLHTPMGYICLGKTPAKDHPFFMHTTHVTAPILTAIPADDVGEEVGDEDWEEDESDKE
ncbi:hypothetical protein GGI43DRAFT_200758 [Trichoderma evansii]